MSKSLYFIDTRVNNYKHIIKNLSSNDTYILIFPEQDGLTHIKNTLLTYHNLDALHIVFHNTMGQFYLGNTLLTQENQLSYKAFFQHIAGVMSPQGDIFLYGDEMDQSTLQEMFKEALAPFTDAHIATLTLPTLGEDVVLEKHSGSMETEVLTWNYNVTLTSTNFTLSRISSTDAEEDDAIYVGHFSDNTIFKYLNGSVTLIEGAQNHGSIDTSSDILPEISDPLNDYDTSLWTKSDGWSNGGVFANSWEDEQIVFSNGVMQLRLEEVDGTLVSGEYQSNEKYGHGYYEVSLKASDVAGTINGFFTYTGPSEGTPHDEIDVEIKGDNPTFMQVNYWTNGVEHPVVIDLGFDASMAFHSYGFSWQADKIEWYVDGQLVHTEDGSQGALPTHFGKIITNLWGTSGAGAWSSDYDVSNGEAVLEVTHISYSSDATYRETAHNSLAISDLLDLSSTENTLVLHDAMFQNLVGKSSDTIVMGEGESVAGQLDDYLTDATSHGALYAPADGGTDAVNIAIFARDESIHSMTLVPLDFAMM